MPDPAVSIEDGVASADREDFASLSELAYNLIRADILGGQLDPGAKLKMVVLQARYGLRPTPLRAAMSRLSSEGLVVLKQQRGFRVAPLTLTELQELSDLRLLLEVQALRLAIANGDDDWEGAIVSAFHKLDRLELQAGRGHAPPPALWEERNREFHDALVAAAGSQLLLRTRAHLYDLHGRYRLVSRQHYSGGDRAVHLEHQALMQAALDRDTERAALLMRDHIQATVKVIRSKDALAKFTAGSQKGTPGE